MIKWKKVKLKQFLKQYKNKHMVQDNKTYRQVKISQTGKVSFRGEKQGSSIGRKRQFIINLDNHPNTLIFIRQGVMNGGIGICPPEVNSCVVTENMPMFEIVDINSEYLINFIKSPIFKKEVNKLVPVGTAQKALHENKLLEIEIPYLSEKEQEKVVKKIQSMENEIKELEENFQKDQTFLTKLRQSILQEAVQGKLVPQNPKDEPAIELLKKIKKEKEKLVKEGKIKKWKELPKIEENEIPYELPKEWVWCRLGEVCEFIYGKGLKKENRISEGKYPVYGSNGIVGNFNNYLTDKRAIIIGRKGSAGALNISELPSWTTDVAYYIEESKNLDFKFIFYLLKTLNLESIGKGIKPGLNRNEVYILPISLPPLVEQKRIVAKVNELMRLCDELEVQIKENKKSSELLMNAVLRESFEG